MDRVKQLSEVGRRRRRRRPRHGCIQAESTLQAIQADTSIAKLYSQRCTAYLELQDYAKALEDAKVLVRMLPDAPMGYLKAARCYRLLRKWKAAQKMLDKAAEMSDDEATLRAIRSETGKLRKAEREPLPSCIAVLPEELFIEALSYLPTKDIFAASQVSQRWRRVVHSRKELWHTAVFLISSALDKDLRRMDDKIDFYLERLQGTSLKHLTIGLSTLPETFPTAQKKPLTSYKDAMLQKLSTNGMLTGLISLWMVNLYREDNISTLFQPCRANLLHFKYTLAGGTPMPLSINPTTLVFICPRLQTLAISDRPYQSNAFEQRFLHYSPLPQQYSLLSGAHSEARPRASLRNISIHCRQGIDYDETYEELGNRIFEHLEHIDCQGSDLFIPYMPKKLASLVFGGGALEIARGPHRENDKILNFTKLDKLHILADVPAADVSMQMRRTRSPDLRSFHLASTPLNRGSLGPRDEFGLLVATHPSLEDIKISCVTIPHLTQSLKSMANVQRLSLIQSDLDTNFLDEAATHLPKLRYLDLSHCSNVTSGPLLRLVKAKNGQLEELGIEGCRELQKEAVEWLKANVKTVRWTGWRDRNEVRGWNFR